MKIVYHKSKTPPVLNSLTVNAHTTVPYTWLIPCGRFRPPHSSSKSSSTQSYMCTLGLFVFRNPPNSELDYRIFNVRTWSFFCVVGHTGESVQHFWLERILIILCVCSFLTGFEPGVFGSRIRWSTNWATPSPYENRRRQMEQGSNVKVSYN